MLKTLLMLLPIFAIIGLAFWFLMPGKTPVIISDQKPLTDTSQITGISEKINSLEEKVDSLESSNSALLNKISILENTKGQKSTTTTVVSSNKTPVLLPINPGGSIDSTDWKSLTSGSITIDPKDYPGYKNAYLIVNLSVYVGQGKAFARVTNTSNGLSILDSEVSTDSYSPVRLTSKAFKLPAGLGSYTVELRTLVAGYPAQAADSFLQITY